MILKHLFLAAGLAFLLGGCGVSDRVDPILALDGNAAAGAAIYSENCSSCHAGDGSGNSGPDIRGSAADLGDAALVDQILDGSVLMPDFGDDLSDQQVADLVAWIKQELG